MNRTPIAVAHRVQNAINWYGYSYTFKYYGLDEFGEPSGEPLVRQIITGLYHSSERVFIELLNSEGTAVKAKSNKGILCLPEMITVEQGDLVSFKGLDFKVTACEPVLYGDIIVAKEISLEEIAKGS